MVDIVDHLIPPVVQVEKTSSGGLSLYFPGKEVSKESLIIGALETAFWDMVILDKLTLFHPLNKINIF